MAQQTTADDSFDLESYRDSLVDAGVDAIRDRIDRYDHPSDAVSEVGFEVADEEVSYNPVDHSLAILEESPNEPEEWSHLAEGKDDWREVIRVMAFTVARRDFYEALQERGYIDSSHEPTAKLTDPDE